MISIQQSLSELDKSHRMQSATLECYVSAINSMAQYAVELDAATTGPHRRYLSELAQEIGEAGWDVLTESRSRLRGLLRDYRDQAAKYLNALRDQMNATTQALQTVDALSQSDGDHAASVGAALVRLREVARSPEASGIRAVVLEVADCIEESLEKIRNQHQLTVSQFHSEIRLLHNRVDALESAAATDEATKFANRRSISECIRSLKPETASLLLLKTQGLAGARATHGQSLADDLVAILSRRLRNSLPKGAVVGRWGEQDFVAVLPGKPAEETAAQAIADHLSTPYACLQNGRIIRLAVQVSTEYLPIAADDSPEQLLARVAESFGQ